MNGIIFIVWVIIAIILWKRIKRTGSDEPQTQFVRPDENRRKDAERLTKVYGLTLAAPAVPGVPTVMKAQYGDYRILITVSDDSPGYDDMVRGGKSANKTFGARSARGSEGKLIYDVKFTAPLNFEGCMIRGSTGMISQLLKGHPIWGSSKLFGENVTPFACSANTQKDFERFIAPPVRQKAILELIEAFPEIIINPSGVHVMDQSLVPSAKVLDIICERMEAIEFPDRKAAGTDEKRFAPIPVPGEQESTEAETENFAGLPETAPKRFSPIPVPPIDTQETTVPRESKPKADINVSAVSAPSPMEEVKPEKTEQGPAGKSVPVDDTISEQSISEKLFSETFTGANAEKAFAEFAGKRVRWSGKLVSIMPFSMDFVFRGKKGVKASFEIYEMKGKFGGTIKIKAIAAFPESARGKLDAARNQIVSVEGTLLKFESFMHEIYLDDADL